MMVGWVIYELLLVRLKPDEFERSILVTLGLSIIIIHVMQYIFTATPRLVDTQYGFEGVEIGSIRSSFLKSVSGGASLARSGNSYRTSCPEETAILQASADAGREAIRAPIVQIYR